jgi:hypothetical protein
MSSESKNRISESFYLGRKAHRSLFNIEERVLEYKSELIKGKARRQIIIYLRQASFQPRLKPEYIRRTNIIILEEILFKSFNVSKILNQKRDQSYEES